MTDKLKGILIAAAAAAALAAGGATIAIAQGGGEPAGVEAEEATEDESRAEDAAEAATGLAADDAAKAALEAVGGGRVLEVEEGDDGMDGYEVEIERPDGSYVEVNLDENQEVVSTGGDD